MPLAETLTVEFEGDSSQLRAETQQASQNVLTFLELIDGKTIDIDHTPALRKLEELAAAAQRVLTLLNAINAFQPAPVLPGGPGIPPVGPPAGPPMAPGGPIRPIPPAPAAQAAAGRLRGDATRLRNRQG